MLLIPVILIGINIISTTSYNYGDIKISYYNDRYTICIEHDKIKHKYFMYNDTPVPLFDKDSKIENCN